MRCILTLSGKAGGHVRASVSSFGPLLLGKVLDLSDTEVSVLSMVFHYCDQNKLPLLDLADLRTTLKYLGSDDGKPILEDLGGIAPATLGVILRSVTVLEQDGSGVFFGEPEFDVNDLLTMTPDGRGVISLLEVADVMDKPRLYATFVLWMLARLYTALKSVMADAQAVDWSEAHAVRFRRAMDDDFNTPEACAVLFDLAAELNRSKSPVVAAQLRGLAALLGLLQRDPQIFLQAAPASEGELTVERIEALIADRVAAKKGKDYAESDRIRAQLLAAGVVLEDGAQGTSWRRA